MNWDITRVCFFLPSLKREKGKRVLGFSSPDRSEEEEEERVDLGLERRRFLRRDQRREDRRCSCQERFRRSERQKEEMNKLLEYGRKAWFIVRVMSGYEERRIRAYRLQLQEKIKRAQAKKEEVKKLPEEVILSEVRRMVEEMQGLNRVLEETEAKIEQHFKPIDELAHKIMDMQMEKEERQMKNLMKVMQDQAMMQREATMRNIEASYQKEVKESSEKLENQVQQAQEQKQQSQ